MLIITLSPLRKKKKKYPPVLTSLFQSFLVSSLLTLHHVQPSESLYEQKPEELPVQVSSSNAAINAPTVGSSFASRFEYTDNVQPAETSSGGSRVLNHVAPPKSSSFFSDYGMDSGFTKKTSSNSSKVQVSSYPSFYFP